MKNTEIASMIPAAKRATVNAALEAKGYGGDNYSVPVTVGNSVAATHYALSGRFTPDQEAGLTAVLSKARVTALSETKDRAKDGSSESPFATMLTKAGAKKQEKAKDVIGVEAKI